MWNEWKDTINIQSVFYPEILFKPHYQEHFNIYTMKELDDFENQGLTAKTITKNFIITISLLGKHFGNSVN